MRSIAYIERKEIFNSMSQSIEDIIKNINKKSGANIAHVGLETTHYRRIPFTSPRLNYCTYGGLPVGRLIEFYGEEHGGKALVNGTPVLTENGWVSIEKLNIGDKVYGEDGQLHNVIGVYPQGEKLCYDFKLRDGTSVACSEDHLWSVYTGGQMKHLHYRDCKLNTMSTKDILDNFDKGYYLPDISAMQFDTGKELALHPYLLGLLLGDGGILGGTPHFTNTETDIVEELCELVKDYNCTAHFHKGSQCDWHIVENKKSNDHPINHILRQYGLLGKHSGEKFIPEDYKFASIDDRYDLIAGLINTDGSVWGGVEYESTSPQLINDFWEVCMSLGIYCVKKKYRVRIPASSMTDELIKRLSVKHSIKHNKYLECHKQHIHKHRRKVESITEIGMRECTCIKVDNPTSLFITNDFIPTHNTTTALDIVANYQQMDDRKALWVDSENTLDSNWGEKLGVDFDKLVVITPESQSAEELFEMTLDFIRSGEIGLAVMDSFGSMLSQQEMEKTVEDRTYAGISMALTNFSKRAELECKKHDCTFIGINQIRDDLGAMYAGAIKTIGGRAWKHMTSVRMEFKKGHYINEKGDKIKQSSESPAGNIVLMTMIKNKTCPPNRRGGYYTINYEVGIDFLADLLDVAIKYDIVQKSGAWFTIVNPDTGEVLSEKLQGMSNLYDYLQQDENINILTYVETLVNEKMGFV